MESLHDDGSKNDIQYLIDQLNYISDALVNGNYSVRLNAEFSNSKFCTFKKSMNQILELIELKTSITLIGENSLINDFIDAFSAFANRDFSQKLEVSEDGTFLDAIAAGINMLGEELESSTVSKNELEVERNRLNHSQEIAKIGDWEYYFHTKKFIFSDTFLSVLEIDFVTLDQLFYELTHKLVLSNHLSTLEAIANIRHKNVYSFEASFNSKDESNHYLLNIINHIFDSKGRHIGYKGVVQDITLLKESQIRLSYQSDLQKLISDISTSFISNGFKIKDSVKNVLKSCNLFFDVDRTYYIQFNGPGNQDLEILEFNNDYVKYTTSELFAEEPQLFDICVNAVKSKEIIQYDNAMKVDIEVERRMISKFYVKSFITIPVYGDSSRFAVFGMDCIRNHKKWSDEEINGLKIISNIISDAINRDYFEKSLIVAREKAEESDRLKTAFLMNMSHEIRTPMNGILGFLPLLQEPSLAEEEKQQYLSIVNKSGQRLMDTINDIIEISRIEAGEMEVLLRDVNTNDMLIELYEFFKPEAEAKGIELIVNELVDNDIACIKSDKTKLYSVLTNLIKNAVKFTNIGKIEIGNYLRNDDLVFYVKDTGKGIPYERQAAIFERFVQADIKLTRAHEGSGLGLAIAKAYIDALNGKIWLQSQLKIGSEFYFSLPINKSFSHQKYSQKSDKVLTVGEDDICILIAEDDDASFEFLRVILNQYNYKVFRAETGLEAVAVIEQNKTISLVLMDIKMPEMDGLEATQRIKKINPNIPIIAQTAHAFSGEKEKAFKAGCDGYLTKPIRSVDLINKIREFIKS